MPCLMKSAFQAILAMLFVFLFSSCESTNSLRGGGAAFDDSETARKLDANSHLPDPDIPGKRSFEQWRSDE